jgi:2-polyprenyl-6-methoxyphenol hydroxylase-like FAD-dependent oxidoreductase
MGNSAAMAEKIETQVFVVGGGPVGLAAAIELGRLGVETLLVERGDGNVEQPKLGLVNTRTMEFCRRWGVTREIRAAYPRDYPQDMVFATSLVGYELARQRYPTYGELPPLECSPERHQRCTQIFLDPILRAAAMSRETVALRLNCEMLSYAQDGAGVAAVCRDVRTGRTFEVAAAYMIACDGAGSPVRKSLGIDMPGRVLGHSVNIFFRVPRLWRHHKMGKAERYVLIDEDGTWGNFTSIDGRELWRLTVIHQDGPADIAAFDAPAQLRRGFGIDIDYEILSVMPWTRLETVAERFGDGRVFMAGDAIHCFSPTGGFGGNTGIADAVDLSWKLAAKLAGWGGPGLLESYELERRPIAFRNTSEAARNFRRLTSAGCNPNLLDNSEAGRRRRAEVGERVRAETQLEWESLGIQMGYRYNGSAIVVPDGTPEPPDDSRDYVPSARPGSRAPHAWMADGRSTLDLFGDGFALLRFDPAASVEPLARAAAARSVPLTVTDIAGPGVRALYAAKLAIVRPDGHVAWRADVVSAAESEKIIRTISGN